MRYDKRDTINPEANEHRRESAAEAGIIYYLYNNHDACGDVPVSYTHLVQQLKGQYLVPFPFCQLLSKVPQT